MRAKIACFWLVCLAGSWQAAARHRPYRVNPHIDFVLLDANPLQNIRHTRRIEAVIIDGRLVEAPEAVSGHH